VYVLRPRVGQDGLDFSEVTLSAIVPTHDRPIALRRCLETLRLQDATPAEFEVVVVDDGSTSDIQAVVASVAAGSPIEIRYERQPLTGLNGARNRGARVTRGAVLAFLDDDTLVSPGWAPALLGAFRANPCAAVGGKVDIGLESAAPPWLAEVEHYLAAYDLGPAARWLGDDPVPVGANCAVRRSDFDRLGGFRLGLDRFAGSLVSNGDTEFFRRLKAMGGRLRYEPEASVIHCVPADRLTVAYFTRRHQAQGVSDELLLRLEGHEPSIGHQVGLSREIGKALTTLGRDRLRRRETVIDRFMISYWMARLSAARRGLRVPEVVSERG
jgi:glucosyl-dolichyl phosphate glucuronosyltransferase